MVDFNQILLRIMNGCLGLGREDGLAKKGEGALWGDGRFQNLNCDGKHLRTQNCMLKMGASYCVQILPQYIYFSKQRMKSYRKLVTAAKTDCRFPWLASPWALPSPLPRRCAVRSTCWYTGSAQRPCLAHGSLSPGLEPYNEQRGARFPQSHRCLLPEGGVRASPGQMHVTRLQAVRWALRNIPPILRISRYICHSLTRSVLGVQIHFLL